MSDEHHCHCHEHDHERTSIEEAGGCAVGLTGSINGWNADAEARFCKALLRVGEWVEHESGSLLGHIKAAVTLEDGSGITLNLTDLENGIEHHGTLEPQEKVKFTFMCAVLDVDEHDLKHMMFHAIDDTGLDYALDDHVECCCHDHHHHDGECCHDHHHHDGECCHDHHHHDGECCHDHHHHDEECCHGHHHDGECCHDHHHHDGECCHDHHHHDEECCHGHHHDDDSEKKEKKSFFSRFKKKKE